MNYQPDLYEKRVFTGYAAVFVLLLPVWLLVPKGNEVLWLNGLHTPGLDVFFKNITHVGDGLMMGGITLLLLLFFRYSYGLLMLAALLVHGVLVQIGKRLLSDVPRPTRFFDEAVVSQLHFIEGVKVHEWMSFPSGHTASAFAMAVMLALIVRNGRVALVAGVLAVLAGASRIYLLQHFLLDTLAGGLLGMLVSFWLWMVLGHRFGWLQRPALQKCVLDLFKKSQS